MNDTEKLQIIIGYLKNMEFAYSLDQVAPMTRGDFKKFLTGLLETLQGEQ